jgi:long-chain acyl-CoA synthetase
LREAVHGLHPAHWAEQTPDRAAIIFGGSGKVITYGALNERANRCAHLMRSLNLQVGDRVAMLIENHPAFLEIAWAAQNAGLIFTPIS